MVILDAQKLHTGWMSILDEAAQTQVHHAHAQVVQIINVLSILRTLAQMQLTSVPIIEVMLGHRIHYLYAVSQIMVVNHYDVRWIN